MDLLELMTILKENVISYGFSNALPNEVDAQNFQFFLLNRTDVSRKVYLLHNSIKIPFQFISVRCISH